VLQAAEEDLTVAARRGFGRARGLHVLGAHGSGPKAARGSRGVKRAGADFPCRKSQDLVTRFRPVVLRGVQISSWNVRGARAGFYVGDF